jgi:hypothetical protein
VSRPVVIGVVRVVATLVVLVPAVVVLSGWGGRERGCAPGPVRSVPLVPAHQSWLLAVGHGSGGSRVFAETRRGVFAGDGAGRTWRRIGPGHQLLAIDPIDPRHQVASTGDSLVVSRNGGRSWRPADAPTCVWLSAADVPSGGGGRVIYAWDSGPVMPEDRNKGGVYRSSDGGRSFSRIATYAPSDTNGAAVAVDGRTLYVGAPDGIHTSTSAGKRWTSAKLVGDTVDFVYGVFDAQAVPSVAFATTGTGRWVSAFNGEGGETQRLWHTNDAGATWHPSLELFDVASAVTAPSDGATVYVQGEQIVRGQAFALLLRSRDGGRHWTTMQRHLERSGVTAEAAGATRGPKAGSLVVDPTRPDVLYRDTGTSLQRSVDGGRTFTALHMTASR